MAATPGYTGPVPARLQDSLRFVRGIARAVRRGHPFPPESRRTPAPAPGGSASPGPRGGALARLWTEKDQLLRTEHRLPWPGLERPLVLMHLSDTHLRGPDAWLDRLCAAVRAERPDLIALTGDVITRGWQPAAVEQLLRALPPAPLGAFAVMGNWEYWGGASPAPWAERLAGLGVRLLHNTWAPVGPLSLVGVDDLLAGEPAVDAALAGLPPDRPAVVMTHSPAMFRVLQRPPVRLVLSGHSHAGQVRIPGLGAPFVPLGTGPYVAGWYREAGVDLFVSRGLGWSVAPLRWYCPPELAMLRLEPAAR